MNCILIVLHNGTPEKIAPLLRRAMSHKGPFLAEIMVDETANVFPMVPPGSANRNMIGG